MRRDHPHQCPALVVRLAHETDVAKSQVAEAAVDELRGGARGACTEVGAVDERDGKPSPRRMGRDPCSYDPPADHEHVEGPPSELLDRGLASRQLHGGFVQGFPP
jgi:hypothetical protein